MEVQLAEMTIEDYDEAYALWRTTENVGLSGADEKDDVKAYLARNPGLSLVARCDGKLIGTVLCGHDGRRGYLHHLAVAPAFRRNGVATRLIDQCLSKLHEIGIQKCHIFLYADNESGARFWTKTGWIDRTDLRMHSKETKPTGQR